MMNCNCPLRYNISDWSQAKQCLSNNSRDLYIDISKFVGKVLNGQMIEVKHAGYGTLFAALTSASGSLISNVDDHNLPIPLMTTEEILIQLAKFGFYITFDVQENLSGDMLTYLMTLKNLKYDHLSRISVIKFSKYNEQEVRDTVVAFDAATHPEWLSFGCAVAHKSFDSALLDGTAVNISAMSEKLNFRWDWLTYVATIDQVLAENSGKDIY